ncbi:NAD(P)H-binding protein [Shigella sonnei]|uniref:NAD(P)H-binding protein n=1 Tax=Shigella sonnei TaxID=624 RepID=UPI0006998908|nr:NAD(P)H-binding protein [Shigella sonnei]
MKNVLILGAGGQIARHVINQLADKQTIKQTLFARQPAKIHKPYPTNSKIIMGDVLNHAALKQAMQGQDVVYANLTGEEIEASGLEYTILRPAWLTDEDIIDYELTSRNEPFKGTIVSRKSVAALITDIIDKPEKHIGENIGINQPVTDGDKPLFM